jgi:NADH-ubiquinone oxidoreductase chain 5
MGQLGLMVIAIGLSSYNITLFHLVNHAFYKGLLFLGAGSVSGHKRTICYAECG